MLRAVINFSVREPLVVLLITAVIVVYGWYCTQTVAVDGHGSLLAGHAVVMLSV